MDPKQKKLREENARPAIQISAMFTSLRWAPVFVYYSLRETERNDTQTQTKHFHIIVFAVFGFIGWLLLILLKHNLLLFNIGFVPFLFHLYL